MQSVKYVFGLLSLLLFLGLSSCQLREDPGPLQFSEQPYAITGFDRLDIGDAMYVTVTEGEGYRVEAKGDRRNLNDLEVTNLGNTLVTRFRDNRNRQHTTYITITMPALKSANFYGATTTSISGFENEDFKLSLSGASVAHVDMVADVMQLDLSGSSNLTLSGASPHATIDLTGASLLKAYNLNSENMNLTASGASHAYVNVSKTLMAEASGASSIFYRGDASVSTKVSGASSIRKD